MTKWELWFSSLQDRHAVTPLLSSKTSSVNDPERVILSTVACLYSSKYVGQRDMSFVMLKTLPTGASTKTEFSRRGIGPSFPDIL